MPKQPTPSRQGGHRLAGRSSKPLGRCLGYKWTRGRAAAQLKDRPVNRHIAGQVQAGEYEVHCSCSTTESQPEWRRPAVEQPERRPTSCHWFEGRACRSGSGGPSRHGLGIAGGPGQTCTSRPARRGAEVWPRHASGTWCVKPRSWDRSCCLSAAKPGRCQCCRVRPAVGDGRG